MAHAELGNDLAAKGIAKEGRARQPQRTHPGG
jgi:hypothetical protein